MQAHAVDIRDVDALLMAQLQSMQQAGENVAPYVERVLRDQLRQDPANLGLMERLFVHYQQHRQEQWAGILATCFIEHLEGPTSPMAKKVLTQARKTWEMGEVARLAREDVFYQQGIGRVRQLFTQGLVDEGEEELLLLLDDFPRDGRCLRLLAQSLIYRHEFRLAEVVLLVLGTHEKPDFEIKNNIMLCRFHMGEIDAAEQDLIVMRVEFPGETAVYRNSALVSHVQGNAKDAQFFAGRWAALEQTNALAWLLYGDYLLEKKNWLFARKAYRNAMVVAPEDLRAQWGLARAALGLGEQDQAVASLERIRSSMSATDFRAWLKNTSLPGSVKEALQ